MSKRRWSQKNPHDFNFQYDRQHVDRLSSRLVNGITESVDYVIRNGDPEKTYPGCINLSFEYIEGESLLMALKDIALSSGRCVLVLLTVWEKVYKFLCAISVMLIMCSLGK